MARSHYNQLWRNPEKEESFIKRDKDGTPRKAIVLNKFATIIYLIS
jgi:hypothetical protein